MKYFRFYSHEHVSPLLDGVLGLTCFYDSNGIKYGTTTADNCIYSEAYVYNNLTMEKLFNGENKYVVANNSSSPDKLWWGQIEFPTSIDVAYITYDQYSPYTSTYYYDTDIYSSEDGITWTPFASFTNEYGDRSSHIFNKAILCRNTCTAKYVAQEKTPFTFGPVKSGDIVLLSVLHYDDVSISPTWHFMQKSAALSVGGSKNQYISLFYKRAISDIDSMTVTVTQPRMDVMEIAAIVLNGDLVSECEVFQEEIDSFRALGGSVLSFGFMKKYPKNHYIYLCHSRILLEKSTSYNMFRLTNTSLPGDAKYGISAGQFMYILEDTSPNTPNITISLNQYLDNYSGIPICITRKVGNENTYRFLISRNNTLYKIAGNQLVLASSSTPSAALFQSEGFYPASLCKSLILPTDSLLCWSAAGAAPISPKLIASGAPSAQCIITDNKYFSDTAITGIDTVRINGSSDILLSISIDDGATWKYYNGTAWVSATEEDSGMSSKAVIEALTSVEWAALIGANRAFKFKVKLKTADSYIENIKVSYKK